MCVLLAQTVNIFNHNDGRLLLIIIILTNFNAKLSLCALRYDRAGLLFRWSSYLRVLLHLEVERFAFSYDI